MDGLELSSHIECCINRVLVQCLWKAAYESTHDYVLCALRMISTYSMELNLYFLHSNHSLYMNVVCDNGMVTFTRNMQFGLVHTGQRGGWRGIQ